MEDTYQYINNIAMDSVEIDFACGQPNDSLLPQELLRSAASNLLQTDPSALTSSSISSQPLNYGDNPSVFRNSLAHFLSSSMLCGEGKEMVDPTLLVPTTGVSHGLDMICTMMCKTHNVQRGRSHFVLVEDCTYYLSSHIFNDYGLLIRPVTTDSEGVVISDLIAQLDKGKMEGYHPLFIYMIPLFNNPTGRCISAKRKQELLSVTEELELLIVSDEVYQMLDSSNHLVYRNIDGLPKLPPLRSLLSRLDLPQEDQTEETRNVLVVSSFSKILAPGLRVGWIQCSSREQAQDLWKLGLMRSGSSTCHFTACLVAQLLQPVSGCESAFSCILESQILKLCGIYACRYQALTDALEEYWTSLLPIDARDGFAIEGLHNGQSNTATRPRVGGYFIWVRLPDWCGSSVKDGATPLYQALKEYNVVVRSGVECTGNGKGNGQYIRLCFARLPEDILREGAYRLCRALADFYHSVA